MECISQVKNKDLFLVFTVSVRVCKKVDPS